MKSKETAVEYLYINLLDNPMSNEDVIYNIRVFEQAKEMEKQQIKDAWLSAWKDSMINPLEDKYYEPESEQYYNETFKK
jgi:hypothetical protein